MKIRERDSIDRTLKIMIIKYARRMFVEIFTLNTNKININTLSFIMQKIQYVALPI